ncbi:uncharacterized protein LACBIDRAFT_325329 [Laccaria bicolor S238N-H82]|uniref:Predicted protein n=1 Tax=Laccaria bicolor (strain S238N-H82 / ATCC MYA-4686) TaxID=486041 RepID=B0D4K2_LACBS|nr:uncharacterized protein LACBIDRAFT_325329 [Laccaria bicolor S238N-H82]EDR10357.1 predicted protein [Laccaria bicolor S238N-H82]|eukprot:XP_001878807.1 predicted protein [Laccaria bicolor S238N-H82]
MISLNPFRDISHCDDERRHLSWTNKTCGWYHYNRTQVIASLFATLANRGVAQTGTPLSLMRMVRIQWSHIVHPQLRADYERTALVPLFLDNARYLPLLTAGTSGRFDNFWHLHSVYFHACSSLDADALPRNRASGSNATNTGAPPTTGSLVQDRYFFKFLRLLRVAAVL